MINLALGASLPSAHISPHRTRVNVVDLNYPNLTLHIFHLTNNKINDKSAHDKVFMSVLDYNENLDHIPSSKTLRKSSNSMTDLKLEGTTDNVKYRTWYGVVNVASVACTCSTRGAQTAVSPQRK